MPLGQQLWRIADGRTTPLTALRHQATGIQPYYAFPFGGDRVVLAGNLGWTGVTPEGAVNALRPEIAAGTQPDVGRELWTLELPTGTTAAAWARPAALSAKRAQEPCWKRMRR